MKHLIDGVGFSERAHFECVEQALEVTLRYYGYELEDMLFDEWRFDYWKADDLEEGYVVSPGGPIVFASKLSAFGVDLTYRHCDTTEGALEGIKCLVGEGQPVPVWVDPFYFAYYAPENRRHTVHAVVVVGYDDARDRIHIVDPSPWQQFRGEIARSELEGALGSAHHKASAERHAWMDLKPPGHASGLRRESVRDVVRLNCSAMRGGGQTHMAPEGAGPGMLTRGLAGVRALAADVTGWEDAGEVLRARLMQDGREPLRDVATRRYGHARFLQSVGRQLEEDRLEAAGRKLESLAEGWFVPANMLFRGSRRRSGETLPRVAGRISDLADAEEGILAAVRDAIDA